MLQSIRFSGFRGMRDIHIDLSGSTAIIGKNGSGKTHILEAIHIASGGVLHYFHPPKTDENTYFELSYSGVIGPKNYSLKRTLKGDEYRVQGSKVSGIKYRTELPYRTVLLSPFDMNLLYFAPGVRRDYMDSILARTFAQFSGIKREYEGVLRQRNALLKKIREGEVGREHLDFWDKSFSEKAHVYSLYRKRYYDFLATTSVCQQFLPKYTVQFSYESKTKDVLDIEESIREYLKENRERDIITGHTHIGPHLEDFMFFIVTHVSSDEDSAIDATMMLSRGEMKMLLLGLKQAEILFLEKYLNLPIVLLFDDLFAELDQTHTERVIEIFDVTQVIVTTQRALPEGKKWDDFSCIRLDLP